MSIAEGRIDRGDWTEAVERAGPGWLVLFASWAFLAFLNVSAGLFIASWPERQSAWCADQVEAYPGYQ